MLSGCSNQIGLSLCNSHIKDPLIMIPFPGKAEGECDECTPDDIEEDVE